MRRQFPIPLDDRDPMSELSPFPLREAAAEIYRVVVVRLVNGEADDVGRSVSGDGEDTEESTKDSGEAEQGSKERIQFFRGASGRPVRQRSRVGT